MSLNSIKISIFPDNFALYRIPVFNEIGKLPNVMLTVYSSQQSPLLGSVKIAGTQINQDQPVTFRIEKASHIFFGKYRIWTKGLLKALFQNEFDLIITWGDVVNLSTWFSLIFAKMTGKKLVLWTHGVYGNEKIIKKFSRIFFYSLADSILLYGNKAKAILESFGVNKDKLFVIYNSLNYDYQKQLRGFFKKEKLALITNKIFPEYTDRTKILLFIGRLVPTKKLDVALEAIKILNSKADIYRMVVIGDGPMRRFYEDQAIRYGLRNKVRFLGEVYDERLLAKYFLISDLGIYPGSVGLFAVHAHAYGLPVCTHDESFSRQKPESEIIQDGQTGFFFRENDSSDLAYKIENWFHQNLNQQDIKKACILRVEKAYNPKNQSKIFRCMLSYCGFSIKNEFDRCK